MGESISKELIFSLALVCAGIIFVNNHPQGKTKELKIHAGGKTKETEIHTNGE